MPLGRPKSKPGRPSHRYRQSQWVVLFLMDMVAVWILGRFDPGHWIGLTWAGFYPVCCLFASILAHMIIRNDTIACALITFLCPLAYVVLLGFGTDTTRFNLAWVIMPALQLGMIVAGLTALLVGMAFDRAPSGTDASKF